MDATDHERVAREFFAAFDAVDLERMIALMRPDIVWEVPGRSPVAGRHVGLEAVGAMMLQIGVVAEGTLQTKAREVFANDAGAVVLMDIDMSPPGSQPWHGDDAWVVRTDGSQITHVREHWFDTRGFDELSAWDRA